MNHRELISQLTPLHGASEARAIVRLIMEERFGLSQTDLLLGKDTTLSGRDLADFEKIASQLLDGAPVQHVLGFADFCGHRFRITPDVLIPRPETEELVEWGKECLKTSNHQNLKSSYLLDLCTGSGCIAVSLALVCPEARITAVDVSEAALAVARENAIGLGAKNINFICADILADTLAEIIDGLYFTMLTANPPYVRNSEAADMTSTVLHYEPSLALFVPDEDPLLFYRAIARIGHHVLLPGGCILVELNTALASDTLQLFCNAGYADVQLRCDQFNRQRMLCARVG